MIWEDYEIRCQCRRQSSVYSDMNLSQKIQAHVAKKLDRLKTYKGLTKTK